MLPVGFKGLKHWWRCSGLLIRGTRFDSERAYVNEYELSDKQCLNCVSKLLYVSNTHSYRCLPCGKTYAAEFVDSFTNAVEHYKSGYTPAKFYSVYNDILALQKKLNEQTVKDDYKNNPATASEFDVEPLDGPEHFKFL